VNFNCPYCHKRLNLMDLQLESDLMAIIGMQSVFGRHADLVWGYIELFGITPRTAKAKKIRTLLEDMRRLLEAGEFSYRKKQYRISRDGIAEALNSMVRRSFEMPLANHNYLKTVMIPIAEREGKDAGRKAEEDLRAHETRLRSGVRENATREMGVRAIGDILKNIG